MLRTALSLAAFLASLAAMQAASAEECVLAEAGKAFQPIVLSQQATEKQRELAAELAEILKQISGVQFEVVTGGGDKGIVLGTRREFPAPA